MNRSLVATLVHALGDLEPWLRLTVGRPSGPDWYTAADLAHDGGIIDELLSDALADPRRPRQVAARSLFSVLAMRLVIPQVHTLRRLGRLPWLSADQVYLRGGSGWPAEIAWDTSTVLVLADDPAAGHESSIVVDAAGDAYRHLVTWAWETLDPVLEVVRSRVRVGRAGMWGAVVDCFAEVGPEIEDPDPEGRLAELDLFASAAKGTPMEQPVPVIPVAWGSSERLQTARSTCCLFYKEPDDGTPMPEYLAGPWERYCTACPLIPPEEANRRLLRRLQQIEKERV
jgi:hypothetical protein